MSKMSKTNRSLICFGSGVAVGVGILLASGEGLQGFVLALLIGAVMGYPAYFIWNRISPVPGDPSKDS